MRNNVHSRSFFLQWQMLYAASNPGQRKDNWKVDGVDWTKERHTYWGKHYSITLEIHRLDHQRGNKIDWQLMVVTENWWGPDRQKVIRGSCWNKIMSGKPEQILAWLKKQDVERRSLPPLDQPLPSSIQPLSPIIQPANEDQDDQEDNEEEAFDTHSPQPMEL